MGNCVYEAALNKIGMFAEHFERFFNRLDGSQKDRMVESTKMRQIVEELPSLLQSIQKDYVDSQDSMDYVEYESDFICSKLSHILANECHMQKNAAMAIIMPSWCKYLLRRDIDDLAVFARQVWSVPEDISVSSAAQERIALFQCFIC